MDGLHSNLVIPGHCKITGPQAVHLLAQPIRPLYLCTKVRLHAPSLMCQLHSTCCFSTEVKEKICQISDLHAQMPLSACRTLLSCT